MSSAVTLERYVGPALLVHGGGAVVIYEGSFAPELVIPCHVHAEHVVSLVLDGDGIEEVGSRVRPLSAQDLLLTPAYAPHGYRFSRGGRWFNMQLTSEWLARVADGAPTLLETAQIIHSRTAAAWAARVRTEVRARDAVSSLAIDGAMALMIADIARSRVDSARTRPRWLRGVEEALEASVASPPSMDELAALAGVHPTHLLRTFRRFHGATISNYVRERRIQRARIEVAKADRPLSAIALDAGFSDQSHFTRVFHQAFGETPGRYARSLRGR
ncbi:AraC family transcriptional regulator [Gemmatimonas sp.]|uniref:AraC family transcriptional regulator n=1 Tax=Gemmatimonas sp. TaxID=1962908 RepID=UPI00286DE331|nr:AraC family transcriptional regulator [Gemmatimonas sp.]